MESSWAGECKSCIVAAPKAAMSKATTILAGGLLAASLAARGASGPGLSFEVYVTDGGRTVGPASHFLRAKALGDGSVAVSFEKFVAGSGRMGASLRIRNGSARTLLGARLDLKPAASGGPSVAVPPTWGEVGPSKDFDPAPLEVVGLPGGIAPVTVTFLLSGWIVGSSVDVDARALDVDAAGRLLVCDGTPAVKRVDEEGRTTTLFRLPGPCECLASASRSSGDVFATARGVAGVLRFDASGAAKGPVPGTVEGTERPSALRVDASGSLLVFTGAKVRRHAGERSDSVAASRARTDGKFSWSVETAKGAARLVVRDDTGSIERTLGRAAGGGVLSAARDVALGKDGRVFVAIPGKVLVLEPLR